MFHDSCHWEISMDVFDFIRHYCHEILQCKKTSSLPFLSYENVRSFLESFASCSHISSIKRCAFIFVKFECKTETILLL